jgi:hypothetical protein
MTDCLHNCGEFCIKQFLVIGKFRTCFGYYKRIDNQEAAKPDRDTGSNSPQVRMRQSGGKSLKKGDDEK